MEEFKKLGISDNIIKVLEKKGFTKPTTIQTKAIPLLLEGKKDVVGQSQTGTGKTAGFGIPIIQTIEANSKKTQAIILTPTRELAMQVARAIDSLKGNKRIEVLAVYGGSPIGPQRAKLRAGVEIVVGTPGRVIDLIQRNSLKLGQIKFAVLDEADEMLNMGFVEDIETILDNAPLDKTMLLFSATMPRAILNIAKKYMREYEFIEVEKTNVITQTVEQIYYDVNARERVAALQRIIDSNLDFYGIIFCNTKATVDHLAHKLSTMNYSSAALHGDITQSQREKILLKFRNKQITILVATDVAARGIDVNDLTHVVNYSLPQSPESYVHRIGRTGRAGKKGTSITLVIPSERRKLSFVERTNRCKLIKHNLPTVESILKNKKIQIIKIIGEIVEANEGKSSSYDLMAKELLARNKPLNVVSAILKYSFKNQFESKSYDPINEVSEGKNSRNSSSGSSKRGKRRSPRRDSRGRRRESRSGGSRQRSSNSSSERSDNRSEGRTERRSEERSNRKPSSRNRSGERLREGRSSSRKNRTRESKSSRSSESRGSDKPEKRFKKKSFKKGR